MSHRRVCPKASCKSWAAGPTVQQRHVIYSRLHRMARSAPLWLIQRLRHLDDLELGPTARNRKGGGWSPRPPPLHLHTRACRSIRVAVPRAACELERPPALVSTGSRRPSPGRQRPDAPSTIVRNISLTKPLPQISCAALGLAEKIPKHVGVAMVTVHTGTHTRPQGHCVCAQCVYVKACNASVVVW